MHSHAPAPAEPTRPHYLLRGLLCALVLGWIGKPAVARLKSPRASLPESPPAYLRVTGTLPLRFQPVPPPPTPIERPAASGPPLPPGTSAETKPPEAAPESKPASADVSLVPVVPAKATAPIIPDETRPRVQAEDFLPFFQFPGSPDAPSVQLVVPTNPPHHATPSTATYRQQ